jgi:hypothetical protein
MAIDRVLAGRVTEEQLGQLQRQQVTIDEDQAASSQYKHAMRSSGQSIADAVEQANTFVRERLTTAIESYRSGDSDSAMASLGEAIHTLQDATSPSHRGFQEWHGPGPPVGAHALNSGPVGVVVGLAAQAMAGAVHALQENQYPSGDTAKQLEGVTAWAYDVFLQGVTDGEGSIGGTHTPGSPARIDFFDRETGGVLLPNEYLDSRVRSGDHGALPTNADDVNDNSEEPVAE